jgi:[ribosomal protein S5]-alanine N-acetyltransferase
VTALDRIVTERLIGERPSFEDAEALSALMLHPDVLRTTWYDPDPPTRGHIADKLAGDIEHWDRYGFGPWLWRDRSNPELIGRGGLKHTTVTGIDEVEIGWTIHPDRWGEGLATELAQASVQSAFDVLGLDGVIAYTANDNIASWRVMEKAGMQYDREIIAVGLPHVLYRAQRDRA